MSQRPRRRRNEEIRGRRGKGYRRRKRRRKKKKKNKKKRKNKRKMEKRSCKKIAKTILQGYSLCREYHCEIFSCKEKVEGLPH
jgi:hypothetical protein